MLFPIWANLQKKSQPVPPPGSVFLVTQGENIETQGDLLTTNEGS